MTLHLIDDKTAAKSQRYRWQLKASNGKILAASTEGFSSRTKCAGNLVLTRDALTGFLTYDNRLDCDFVEFSDTDRVKVKP